MDARRTYDINTSMRDKTGINVRYEIISEMLDEPDIRLKLILEYDAIPSHRDFISCIFYNTGFCNGGVLSQWSRYEKFNLKNFDFWKPVDNANHITINDKEILEITFKITCSDSDYILQLLSIISDGMTVMKRNKIDFNFNIFDIVTEITHAYTFTNVDNCGNAVTLNQLIAMISNNPDLAHDDAILLLYCFTALPSFDPSLYEIPNNITMLCEEVIDVIDQTLFIKSKPAGPSGLMQECVDHDDINVFLNRLNLCQRIKMYRPCIGRPNREDGLHQWHDLVWFFLRDVKFTLCKNGLVYIDVSRDKNPDSGYAENYASDENNYKCFSNDLLALAPHIDLTFKPDNEWHKQIYFTPDCAGILSKMNLHLDGDIIKKMVRSKQNYSFFLQATRTGTFTEIFSNEVIQMIFSLAYHPLFSIDELNLSKNHCDFRPT